MRQLKSCCLGLNGFSGFKLFDLMGMYSYCLYCMIIVLTMILFFELFNIQCLILLVKVPVRFKLLPIVVCLLKCHMHTLLHVQKQSSYSVCRLSKSVNLNVVVEFLQVCVVGKHVLQRGTLPTHLLLHLTVDQWPVRGQNR